MKKETHTTQNSHNTSANSHNTSTNNSHNVHNTYNYSGTPANQGMSTANWIALLTLIVTIIGVGITYASYKEEASSLKEGKSMSFFTYITNSIVNNSSESTTIPDVSPTDNPTSSTGKELSEPESLVRSELKPLKGNALIVESSTEDYQGLFADHASEILNTAGISHRLGELPNGKHKIVYSYNLKRDARQSGMREAFNYSLTVNVKVLTHDGTVCFTDTYKPDKPRIGYPEDSEDKIESLVIQPLLEEVEKKININQEVFC